MPKWIHPKTKYGSFRARLLVRIFAAKPTPNQVADCLEQNKQRFPQISLIEIERYRNWGERWPEGDPSTLLDHWERISTKDLTPGQEE